MIFCKNLYANDAIIFLKNGASSLSITTGSASAESGGRGNGIRLAGPT